MRYSPSQLLKAVASAVVTRMDALATSFGLCKVETVGKPCLFVLTQARSNTWV